MHGKAPEAEGGRKFGRVSLSLFCIIIKVVTGLSYYNELSANWFNVLF